MSDQLAFDTGNRVLSGRVYKFMGWTKLIDRKRTGDVHSLELWIRFKKRGEKEQKKKRLARRTKFSQGKSRLLPKENFREPFGLPKIKVGSPSHNFRSPELI